MGFLDILAKSAKMVTSPEVMEQLVRIKAERAFQSICQELFERVPAEDLENLAVRNTNVKHMLTEYAIEVPTHANNPGVTYLLKCSDDHLLALMEEVAPKHVKVLRAHHDYALQMVGQLKSLGEERNTVIKHPPYD